MPFIRDRGLSVQRGHTLVGALVGAGLLLSSCGQPLVGLPAGNSAAQTVGSATPGVPNAAASTAAFGTTGDQSTAPTAIVAVPETSAAPVDGAIAPATSAAPVAGADAAPPAENPAPAVPAPEPTVNPAFNNVTLPGAEERWRYVQLDRVPLPAVQTYTTPSRQILWWYDPELGRTVRLGEVQGDFPVQATFRFRGQEVDALEVPYQINQSLGITLPAATIEQIRRAGFTGDWIEAFIYKTEDIRPK